MKPLNRKNYGSIPHLIGSKIGETDKYVHEGQHRILTEKTRDKYDFVIVTEKYDGSNVGITKVDGRIMAITRSGYLAETSPYSQHHYFSKWVEFNKSRFDFIKEGERFVGEWMLVAHGTKYRIADEPFLAFDYFIKDNERLIYDDFLRLVVNRFHTPRIIYSGYGSLSIEEGMKRLLIPDPNFETEQPEGLVYRVERKCKFDFIAKYVRPGYESGKYIIGVDEKDLIWNMNIYGHTD